LTWRTKAVAVSVVALFVAFVHSGQNGDAFAHRMEADWLKIET
jgi:hypothetical protein